MLSMLLKSRLMGCFGLASLRRFRDDAVAAGSLPFLLIFPNRPHECDGCVYEKLGEFAVLEAQELGILRYQGSRRPSPGKRGGQHAHQQGFPVVLPEHLGDAARHLDRGVGAPHGRR